MAYVEAIPVNVITGFLGSGKTTLLQALLKSPALADTAVLVNEFGEVGLDHHLLKNTDTPTLLMDNGCLCCAIRGDLQQALRDLYDQRERGQIPKFKRVIIETSGLADPAPIAYTVLAEPVLQHHFRLGNVITVVDCVNGMAQLARFDESVKQVAVADRLVLTKGEIAEGEQIAALKVRLTELNLSAPVIESVADPLAGQHLAQDLIIADLTDPASKAREAQRWVSATGAAPTHHHHTDAMTSFAVLVDEPLDWTAFGIWMTMLLNHHGDKVLRIKGLLQVTGVDTPVLINGVQHIVHPPVHLPAWPDADHRSRIVFIVHGLSREPIEASLAAFNGLVQQSDQSQPASPAGSTATPA